MQEFWSVFLADLEAFCLALAGLALLVAFGEGLHRWAGVRPRVSRRIVHVGTGCFVAGFPLLFEHAGAVYLLAGTFVLVNGISLTQGRLPGLHPAERGSWGTVSFPLSLLIVLPFAWAPDRIFAFQTAFLILGISDSAASWVGERISRKDAEFPGRNGKTWPGSAAFYLSALGITLGAGLLLYSWPDALRSTETLLVVALVVPLVGTAVEFLGGEGWDNLFLGVSVSALLVIWGENPGWTEEIAWAVGAGFLFAVAAIRMEYLTPTGAVAGGLFAATLLAFGGWPWAVPGFVFFFLSSALTKVRHRTTAPEVAKADEPRRSARQVYANGGVAWSMVILYALVPDPLLYWAFLGAISAATADTWASEIGPLVTQRPRLILSGRRVPSGTSGAVSAAGTLAGLAGGAAVWAAAQATAPEALLPVSPGAALGIVLAGGAVGSLMDSIVGATVQSVYRDSRTGELVERPEFSRGRPLQVGGYRWMTNERVNWACTTAGAATTAGLSLLL